MPYATIDEILSRVDRRSPCPPGQFPDFDPEDLNAWAYFIYVYLDCSQADLRTWPSLEPARRGWPSFLPNTMRAQEEWEMSLLPNLLMQPIVLQRLLTS